MHELDQKLMQQVEDFIKARFEEKHLAPHAAVETLIAIAGHMAITYGLIEELRECADRVLPHLDRIAAAQPRH